jgi:hypothetical protein
VYPTLPSNARNISDIVATTGIGIRSVGILQFLGAHRLLVSQ